MGIIILGMIFLAGSESYSRQLEFVNEEVELLVHDTSCTVQGSYGFRNTASSSVEQTLYYPFVLNTQLPFPDTVSVIDSRGNHPVHFTRTEQGVLFGVRIPPSSTVLYHVFYSQRTPARSMCYPLRTTSQWGRPLKRALYRVCLPLKYVLTSSTMVFPQMTEGNGDQLFERCEENFMPEIDFAIQWKRRMP
jgi:hypothetical protein